MSRISIHRSSSMRVDSRLSSLHGNSQVWILRIAGFVAKDDGFFSAAAATSGELRS